MPLRCARTGPWSASSSSTSGSDCTSRSRIRTGNPSVKAYGLSSLASVPANGPLRQPSSSSQKLAERGEVVGADLDPAAVAEVAVFAVHRQLEQSANEEALTAAVVEHGGVLADPCTLPALLVVEEKDRIGQPQPDVTHIARVRRATHLARERHKDYAAAVAEPGRYRCQTLGIVGVARWMNSTGAGARGGRCR